MHLRTYTKILAKMQYFLIKSIPSLFVLALNISYLIW